MSGAARAGDFDVLYRIDAISRRDEVAATGIYFWNSARRPLEARKWAINRNSS